MGEYVPVNSSPILLVKKKENGVVIPKYESPGAAGMDLCAFLNQDITVAPLERVRIPTGLYIEIPQGYEAQIRPRSGLAFHSGISVLNTPGTIDSDYRGEVGVIIINLGREPFTVKNGDRIAQMVISPVMHVTVSEAEFLSDTERGAGGFGSTGI